MSATIISARGPVQTQSKTGAKTDSAKTSATSAKSGQSSLALEKTLSDQPILNPAKLRQLGVEHLQELAGETWTDHNVHDPGHHDPRSAVLCHHRPGISRQSPDRGPAGPTRHRDEKTLFFTAAEILTCNPVTIRDYRKLIIDCDGVRNAWLELAERGEQKLYIDRDDKKLQRKGKPEDEIPLRGLYHLYLELDEDPELGDLNHSLVETRLEVSMVDDTLPGSPEVDETWLVEALFLEWRDPPGTKKPFDISKANWLTDNFEWTLLDRLPAVDIELRSVAVSSLSSGSVSVDAVLATPARPIGVTFQLTASGKSLNDETLRAAVAEALDPDDGGERGAPVLNIVRTYLGKVRRRRDIVHSVLDRLHAHRNLCEDFLTLRGMRVEEIAICADIEVAPDAEVDEIQAEILFRAERLVNPGIRFRSLQDLEARGLDPDTIFDGPRLDHGFIDDRDLDRPLRQTVINASDLIDKFMQIPGVIAVKDFLLTSYIDGQTRERNREWSLTLSPDKWRMPRVSEGKSRFRFFKGFIPHAGDASIVDELLDEKRAQARRPKLARERHDREIPRGDHRALDSYTSIQRHFPLTYGIGRQVSDLAPMRRGAPRLASSRHICSSSSSCWPTIWLSWRA